uniref:receptor protein-tyrosine kinase n=1 Tax=Crassostrea virginica TaxID=6565 RepID=A0A8B8BPX3_CRAVI|nr:fibroblast growth factor receptor 1-A-like [Crassostrea virginica]
MYAVVLLMFCICSWVALLCPSVQAYEAPRLKQDDPAQESMTVNEGSKLRLKCRVLGSPRPYIVWYKNGKKLTRREDKRLNVNKNSLLITQPREKDSGQYSCYRENQYGHVWKNYSLTILNEKESEEPKFVDCKTDGPPQFKDRSKLNEWIERPAQEAVDFQCDVCGSPEPNVTWYFKDRRIFLGVSSPAKYKVKRKTSLVVDKLNVLDAGEYTCVGQNEHGSVNHTFELKVIDRVLTKPVIQGLVNQTVTYMDDVRFDCIVVMSDLQPHIQWLKHYEVNGSYINEDDEPYVHIIQQSSLNLTKPETLFIRNVTYEDAGWYTCLATNAMGRAFQSAWLTVVKNVPPINSPNTVNLQSDLLVTTEQQENNSYMGLPVIEVEQSGAEDTTTTSHVPQSTESTRFLCPSAKKPKIKPDDVARMQYEVLKQQKKKLEEQTVYYQLMNKKLRMEMGLLNED